MKTDSRKIGAIVAVSMLGLCVGSGRSYGQTFNAGSDGSDGIYAPTGSPGTVINFDPTQFQGTQAASHIFNFTTITIPSGVTVRLRGDKLNGPVFWLAQGDVTIDGTLDLSGAVGYDGRLTNPFVRVSAIPGPGGYPGGVGSNCTSGQAATIGGGPGGGTAGICASTIGGAGTFSGNQFLIPLIGGSGGGGGAGDLSNTFGPGGGAGGGAILVASSTQIVVRGRMNVNGGGQGWHWAGGGSGGAIRLIANAIGGNGSLTAHGGDLPGGYGGPPGGPGIIRLESYATSFSGPIDGTRIYSSPFPLLLPTAGSPTAKVISINGILINANPNTFPDITINTSSAVPVVIQTHNIPTTATIKLTILNQNGVADTVITAPPLGSCDADNFCTTTVSVVFPYGGSRGLTKVTWTP